MPITREYTKNIATTIADQIGLDKISIHEVENAIWIIGKDHCLEFHYYMYLEGMSLVNNLHNVRQWISTIDDFTGHYEHDLWIARKVAGL